MCTKIKGGKGATIGFCRDVSAGMSIVDEEGDEPRRRQAFLSVISLSATCRYRPTDNERALNSGVQIFFCGWHVESVQCVPVGGQNEVG